MLAEFGETIASNVEGARPVDADAMHLTWAFVGAVSEDHVPAVATSLEVAAFEMPGATECTVSGGAVALDEGRVLALDVDVELLAVLGAARDRFIDAVSPYAPIIDRRAWRPHVTVLRAGSGGRLTAAAAESMGAPNVRWIAPELWLYASLPGPQGRQHRALHAVPFGARTRDA